MNGANPQPKILLTGATGCIGGRLLEALEAAGRPVRCMTRRPDALEGRVGPQSGVVRGDCLDPDSLQGAFAGIDTAYYMVHSMGGSADFEARDREAARNFGEAARAAGVSRIVYVGGLGAAEGLSRHLRSRHETGEVLRASGVPVVEFRSGIVLGAGSLSFELIRALVERLPVMVCPSWVRTPTQPIALADLIAYLVAALDLPHGESRLFEIGGADAVSYREIMREYARQRGLRRLLIPVPLLTPRLSSLWLGLTTPVYARVGRELVDGLRTATVVNDTTAKTVFPIRPLGLREAIARAVEDEDAAFADTPWSKDALAPATVLRWGGVRIRSRLIHSAAVDLQVGPEAAFVPIRCIGGVNGWYYGDWMWRLRGLVDRALGGVGMNRGRRDPENLAAGDVLDCWRVDVCKPNVRMRLAAEMKLPGRGWLEFDVKPRGGGASRVRQTAVFDPSGLWGRFYWHALYPVHVLLFGGLLRSIARRAIATEP
ncbi:MAG: SDR family oxidoreductase [Gemmatimonadota bacterium]|nr:SDR family oxidoreductase [Gemmatimonadota bacterium]